MTILDDWHDFGRAGLDWAGTVTSADTCRPISRSLDSDLSGLINIKEKVAACAGRSCAAQTTSSPLDCVHSPLPPKRLESVPDSSISGLVSERDPNSPVKVRHGVHRIGKAALGDRLTEMTLESQGNFCFFKDRKKTRRVFYEREKESRKLVSGM